jgi:MFS family permease
MTGPGSIEQPYGWVVAHVSLLMMAVGFGAPYLIVVGLKAVSADLGVPREVPSLAYAVSIFGAGLGGILMGWWADRVGLFKPVLLASLMVPLGVFLISRAESPVELYLAHGVVLGVFGNGAMFAPSVANVSRWFDRRRGLAISIVVSGQSLAGAIWPQIFQWGFDRWGWRQTALYYAVFSGVILVPLSLFLRRKPPVPPAGGVQRLVVGAPVFGLPANVVQAMICLAIVGCCIAMAMPMVHVAAFCTDLGFAAEHGARLLSILLRCAFFSRLFWGNMADRIGGLNTILASSSLQAIALSFYAFVDTLPSLYALSIGFGLAFGGIIPTYAVVVREYFPVSEAGWRIGATFLFGTTGMALGGWAGGRIFDVFGFYQAAFMVGVAANLVNLVLVAALRWRAMAVPRLA